MTRGWSDKARRRGRSAWHIISHRGINRGWCPICQGPAVFVERGPWLRDEYLCRRCKSIPRMRALIAVLEEKFPDWRTRRIFEAAGAGPATEMIRANAADYTLSHFYPGVEPGTTHNGHRVENLEQLTFPDESFDLVVTQDVFEHVLRPDAAFAEIARVLRPGGAHVFTVPIWQAPETVVRVRPRDDGDVEHLLPEMFHGDPVSDGSLVVTDWSPDIVDFIRKHSGLDSELWVRRDRSLGIDGEHLEVVITRKPAG